MPLKRTYASNRILVTGGAGFIGSHLCERLLAEGAEAICADNYFTGSRRNIAHLLSNPLFEAMRQRFSQICTLHFRRNFITKPTSKRYLSAETHYFSEIFRFKPDLFSLHAPCEIHSVAAI